MVLHGTRLRLFQVSLPTCKQVETGKKVELRGLGVRLSALRSQPSGLLSIALGGNYGLSVPQFSSLEQMCIVGGLSKWVHVTASITDATW